MPSRIHAAATYAGFRLRIVSSLALLCLLAGCGSQYASRSGGYHPRHDYSPSHYYPPPGPPSDPWGPYIQEASQHYSVPGQWIRAVMHQESGGREQVVSSAGAMGLMQIMPDTYDYLRGRYGLGSDPFEPRDNIMAGTAYIRELYDRFGAPGFLAAYNAGPGRLDNYLAGGSSLPDETVNYVASIAPRLGGGATMTGPLAVYAGGGPVQYAALPAVAVASTGGGCNPDAAYDPSRPCAPGAAPVVMAATAPVSVPVTTMGAGGCDPDSAYDPSRPCAPAAVQLAQAQSPQTQAPQAQLAVASSSLLYRPVAYAAAPLAAPGPQMAAAPPAMAPPASGGGGWAIQVGAFSSEWKARAVATGTRDVSPDLLSNAQIELLPTTPFGGSVIYRSRLGNLSSNAASAVCARLAAQQQPCIVVPPGQAS